MLARGVVIFFQIKNHSNVCSCDLFMIFESLFPASLIGNRDSEPQFLNIFLSLSLLSEARKLSLGFILFKKCGSWCCVLLGECEQNVLFSCFASSTRLQFKYNFSTQNKGCGLSLAFDRVSCSSTIPPGRGCSKNTAKLMASSSCSEI